MSRRLPLPRPVLLAIALLATSCGGEGRPAVAPSDAPFVAAPGASAAPPREAPVELSQADAAARGKAIVASPLPPPFARERPEPPTDAAIRQGDSSATSMVVRNGVASVRVDSLEPAIAAVQRIASSLGGWVGNTTLSAGEHEVRSATIELKLPAPRFDEALAGLRPIGKVETVTSTAEDVGEQYVDLSARVANSRRLEERLVALLATRTGKLEDVLNVERELARVREEIERVEGRLRYLRTRVATSTLVVTVHEPLPLVSSTPGESVIGEAFREAWRNFVRFIAGGIASLGTLVPVGALLWLAAAAWRRHRHRPRRQAATPQG